MAHTAGGPRLEDGLEDEEPFAQSHRGGLRGVDAAIEHVEQPRLSFNGGAPAFQSLLGHEGAEHASLVGEGSVDALGWGVAVEHHLAGAGHLHEHQAQGAVHLFGAQLQDASGAQGSSDIAEDLALQEVLARVHACFDEGGYGPHLDFDACHEGGDEFLPGDASDTLSHSQRGRESKGTGVSASGTDGVVVQGMHRCAVSEGRHDR